MEGEVRAVSSIMILSSLRLQYSFLKSEQESWASLPAERRRRRRGRTRLGPTMTVLRV